MELLIRKQPLSRWATRALVSNSDLVTFVQKKNISRGLSICFVLTISIVFGRATVDGSIDGTVNSAIYHLCSKLGGRWFCTGAGPRSCSSCRGCRCRRRRCAHAALCKNKKISKFRNSLKRLSIQMSRCQTQISFRKNQDF